MDLRRIGDILLRRWQAQQSSDERPSLHSNGNGSGSGNGNSSDVSGGGGGNNGFKTRSHAFLAAALEQVQLVGTQLTQPATAEDGMRTNTDTAHSSDDARAVANANAEAAANADADVANNASTSATATATANIAPTAPTTPSADADKCVCVICLDRYDDPVLTSCAHTFCRECILACLGPSLGAAPCPVCRETVYKNDLITVPRASRFSVDLDRSWRPSAKLNALMDDLKHTLASPLPPPAFPLPPKLLAAASVKCVIISQWTAMLDLVQRPLKSEHISFARLDGTMSQQSRAHTLRVFASDPSLRVLLLSLRAGGVGLNLVSAQTVYMLDPWWNPAVEEQAVNRVHRIGQPFPVRVVHFVVQNSVEDRILELQQKKSALVKGAIGDADAKAMRIDDLKLLFS